VTGNLEIAGTLITNGGSVTVLGMVTILGALVVPSNGSGVTSAGAVAIVNGSVLNVSVSPSAVSAVVLHYPSLTGTFSTIHASSSLACVTVANPVAQYGSTALTVSVTVTQNSCSAGGLSPGAVAAIVICTIVGGVIIAVAIVLVTRTLIKRREARLQANILTSMGATPIPM
jgi:hypothetical protein